MDILSGISSFLCRQRKHRSAFEVDTNESAEPHKAHFERENRGTLMEKFEVVGEWIFPECSGTSCVMLELDETDQPLSGYLMQVLAANLSKSHSKGKIIEEHIMS